MTSYARNPVPVNIVPGPHFPNGQHMPSLRRKFVADLSQCLLDFVIQLLPTAEELAVKEDVRKLLERLIRTIEPDSRLLSFGSTANGFSLRNSDMDLCCLIDSDERLNASDLVAMVGDLLERETKFHVKPLPHARIPIVKLSLDPSPGLPLGIACDIGFENRLALENTRLLLCYSMVDPTRVRTIVLFLKVWSKRRKINSPYKGTLSSYGYVLLVIYFLVHVKNPPVLPNLQQIPPLRPIPSEEYHMGDRNVWFFDDIELLRQRWQSSNTESVADLLIDFFRYYARDFSYNTGIASIRAGLLKKDTKGWQNDNDPRFKDARERNRLCIEDPFEVDYNVARCVTKDGLYLIRGEFMRASRILQARPERAYYVLAQLCEERDESLVKLVAAHNTTYIPPRLSFPPQTPYSIGSNSSRPNGAPERDRLSPPRKVLKEDEPPAIPPHVHSRSPPEHMAPKRTKWTSPPPPEAPDDDLTSFESRLGFGLSLATAATDAREQEKAYLSSSSNSEILSDDGEAPSDIAQDDDVKSVQSFTGEPSVRPRPEGVHMSFAPSSVPHRVSEMFTGSPVFMTYQHMKMRTFDDTTPTPFGHAHGARGRRPSKPLNESGFSLPPVSYHANDLRHLGLPLKTDSLRRSNSGPARAINASRVPVPSSAGAQRMPFNVPLPPSPVHTSLSSSPTIYYETNAHRAGGSGYSASPTSSPVNPFTLYQQQYYVAHAHAQAQAQAHGQSHQVSEATPVLERDSGSPISERRASKLPSGESASTTMQSISRPVHAHTHSTSTIVGPPTPAASSFSQNQTQQSSSRSRHSSPSHSPSPIRTSFPRLSAVSPHQSSSTSPHPTYLSSPRLSSPRPSPPHISSQRLSSPQLSSQLPHIARRQSQPQMHSSLPSQAQLYSQTALMLGLPIVTTAPLSLDLASPSESPVSSMSSGSGSARSAGSLSPVSSTSPRTADLSSPQAPSPERWQSKPDHKHEQYRVHPALHPSHHRHQNHYVNHNQQPYVQTKAKVTKTIVPISMRVDRQQEEKVSTGGKEVEGADQLPSPTLAPDSTETTVSPLLAPHLPRSAEHDGDAKGDALSCVSDIVADNNEPRPLKGAMELVEAEQEGLESKREYERVQEKRDAMPVQDFERAALAESLI